MNEEIKAKIAHIRSLGLVNMLDIRGLIDVAEQLEFNDVAEFLSTEDGRQEYADVFLK